MNTQLDYILAKLKRLEATIPPKSGGGGGQTITVDPFLSTESTNPAQNKVITQAINAKQDTLSAQTPYTAKGSVTKIPQITTNELGQVTEINEVDVQGGGGGGISILDVYPIGAIYMSVNAVSPADLFGGTWEKLEGRFLLGSGTLDDSHAYELGESGGEAEHLLTSDEAAQKAVSTGGISANHAHSQRRVANQIKNGTGANKYGVEGTGAVNGLGTDVQSANHTHSITGSDATNAHNNMPPYIVVNMWQRTA